MVYLYPKRNLYTAPAMPQDFSGQNLRGHSFKGKDLTGANFSGADVTKANFSNATLRKANFTNAILEDAVIKGANFTGSILKNANLSGAKAGLPLYWAIWLLILLFLLAVLSGFSSQYVIDALYSLSKSESSFKAKVSGVATLLVLIFFFIFTIFKGLYQSLQISIFVSAIASSFITAIISVFTGDKSSGVAFAGVVSAAIVNAGIVDSACIILGITQLNIWNSVLLAFIFGLASFWGAIVVPIIIQNISIFQMYHKSPDQIIYYVILTALVIISIMVLSIYIAYKAMKGDEKFTLIHKISIFIASIGGTCFCNADLTEANLTHAILQNTDLREAILKKTCFYEAKGLDSVRSGECYLQNPLVRQLLITGQGQNKNFDRQDLRGVNFKKATLEDASFIGADLSDANLQQADLSRAKLVQTQLDGTNFIGATLTGAYIEDWNITNQTNFTGVRCEYVYMRLPTKENPHPLRKPDNNKEVFAHGEFGDFIKPIFDTLDLYHNQGVDPRAIAISFKELAENHPEAELEIVAMEKRGEDKFLLRAKTADTADKSQLSAEYFDTYNEIKGLPEREIKLLLAEKDSRIRSLEIFVTQALQRPSYYSNVEQVSTMTNNPGGFSVGGSVGGDIRNLQGDNNRATQGDNNQGVLGDGNQVTQQNQVGADTGESLTKEDVVKLLAQLETLIKGAELPADTKEEVIEDLSAAKKATDKEEPNKQRALERLGTVAETLEKTSKGVEAGQKVWTIAKPIIVKVATWLGVAAGSHLLGL